jgi:hypothetical protein
MNTFSQWPHKTGPGKVLVLNHHLAVEERELTAKAINQAACLTLNPVLPPLKLGTDRDGGIDKPLRE